MAMVTVPIPVSGECPRCGQKNNATIQATFDSNARAYLATADAGCGACSSPLQLVADEASIAEALKRL